MEYIKDWCITVIDFKLEIEGNPIGLKQLELYEFLKEEIKSNFNSKDKKVQRGIKGVFNDLQEEAGYWPDKIKTDLNNILYSKFGENINQEKEINKIIKRGKINNDCEYRLINIKVDEICQSDSNSPELDRLNNFLLVYEQNKLPKNSDINRQM